MTRSLPTLRLQTSAAGAARALVMATAAIALGGAVQASPVSGQGTWETTLQPRDLDGNAVNGPEAFYDTLLNITWLRNGNVNGGMNWDNANAWANTLVVGGIGGWRLPMMVDTAAPGCDLGYSGTDCGSNVQTATSEMAHLYYVTLGNKAYFDTSGNPNQPAYGMTNTGNFQDVLSDIYWTGLEYQPDTTYAWTFNTYYGGQYPWSKSDDDEWYALAVHPGDAGAAVPTPPTYAMVLMGLVALWGRRQAAAGSRPLRFRRADHLGP